MVRQGEVFAGFVIERELGRGGMGAVFAARDRRLPRLIALKVMHRDLFADGEIRARFEREADLIAQLDHPNIITVYDRGVDEERLWIAMQFVDGIDAAAVPVPEVGIERITQIATQTASALDYAHHKGVLHRDVKPANILLSRTAGVGAGFDERVLLTDFGIAKLLDDTGGLTRTGQFTATIAYASPEQLSSAPMDHRGDQYSLACTVFRLLTGTGPFDAPNPATVMLGHLNEPPPAASTRRTTLPAAVDAVLTKAMAKDPTHRFPTCTDFATALTQALHHPRSGAAPIGDPHSAAPAPTGAQPAIQRAVDTPNEPHPGRRLDPTIPAPTETPHAPTPRPASSRVDPTVPRIDSADTHSTATTPDRRSSADPARPTAQPPEPNSAAGGSHRTPPRSTDNRRASPSHTADLPRPATPERDAAAESSPRPPMSPERRPGTRTPSEDWPIVARRRPQDSGSSGTESARVSRDAIPTAAPVWLNAVHGCLVGGAIGDALGAPVEDRTLQQIRERYGPAGVTGAETLRISEETQLSAFTVEALIRGSVRARAKGIGGATMGLLQQGMLVWLRGQAVELPEQPFALHSSLSAYPELIEQRGVANSVYTALRKAAGRQAPTNPLGTRDAPINNSKGSGAVMRAAPCGFGYAADRSGAAQGAIFELGCDAAALTHGHPSGWLPAGTLAALVYQLCRGTDTATALDRARTELASYPGHEETSAALAAASRLATRIASTGRAPTPEDLETLGAGWIGPEALSIAVFAVLAAEALGGPPHQIVRTGLLLSINHSGDSDATGALTGSLLGARYGRTALPRRWSNTVDARTALEVLATDYCTEFGLTPPRDDHGQPPRTWFDRYPA
ncbi:ADP-ribosylglycohydrolase family protein [Nocardia sp. NPDC058176]|uniref:ADP-ribosylglycohydrolase family protein n=1 Tax=Nocardia sp. NPDC058176 TaxID=3346368 RepID=UPI0036DBB6FF